MWILTLDILVALRPRLGGYVVAAWLGGIIVNLLLAGGSSTSRCVTSVCCWPL